MNVLFLFDDQHNADCLGFAGHPIVQTPNLDSLAARGVSFDNVYACSAICGPSRTSFFTGTYMRTHERYYNSGDLRRNLPNVIRILKDHGYDTFQTGKNHLPPAIADDFDEMYTLATYNRHLKAKGLKNDAFTAEETRLFMSKASMLAEEDHDEAWCADRAIDFLQSRADQSNPFFMWVSFHRPHAPHTPPPAFDDLYQPEDVPIDWETYEAFENSRLQSRPGVEDLWKAGAVRDNPELFQKAVCRYLALVTFIDKQVGRILKTLQETGLDEETLVVFSSDHGDWAGRYGQIGKNLPAYDPLLRIPFVWYDPARPENAGKRVHDLGSNVDFMPTLLSRLGISIPPTVQGKNLLPLVDQKVAVQRDAVFAETAMEKTIRTHDWKLTYFVRHPERGQLFRMGEAPDEISNLWDSPELAPVKHELLLRLMAWMVSCEQPANSCNDWEEYIDTRWYSWLHRQANDCEIPEHTPRNER
ncbi:MAG: sulfatase-like hydrolase/transferase [Candidatus Pacebacteria bacterium]|nr:sulfatase-like hydrolase/transferase [Candidatus Paceibacterota bacterium]